MADFKTITFAGGTIVYEGETRGSLKGPRPHGHGTTTLASGGTHTGSYENGEYNGFGVFRDKDGNVIYEGYYKRSNRHGYGKLCQENGDRYEGEFKKGAFHGKGTLFFRQGDQGGRSRYIGDFNNGRIHGKGVMIYTDGSEYRGGFANGQFHGKGEITESSRVRTMELFPVKTAVRFSNGSPRGKFTRYFNTGVKTKYTPDGSEAKFGGLQLHNGDKYIGELIGKTPHGYCMLIREGTRAEGYFKDGKLIRWTKVTDENGKPTSRDLPSEVSGGEYI